MTPRTIMIYGATGYSGRLIAHAAVKRLQRSGTGNGVRILLASRDARKLQHRATDLDLEWRAFALDDQNTVTRNLAGVGVVVNAAGPFAQTAERLAKCAIQAHCHYVDINGEVDVYNRIDDLGRFAYTRGVALVGAAAHSGAAADLLLSLALERLRASGGIDDRQRLGAIRVAHSRTVDFSRGSVATAIRQVREDVTIVRNRHESKRFPADRPALTHEPVGRLQRSFDFNGAARQDDAEPDRKRHRDIRIACAMNLVDTLTVRQTLIREGLSVERLESYVEMGALSRLGYQLGALGAPLAAVPWWRAIAQRVADQMPDGPSDRERKHSRAAIVLEIEGLEWQPLIQWQWNTPNVYAFTADLAAAVAFALLKAPENKLKGWCSPAQALIAGVFGQTAETAFAEWADCCQLDERFPKPPPRKA